MAKMFYTLDEAAEKLGVQPDAVKEMAAEGKLQQFRDRDKLMFKRDQVDGLAASAGSSGAIPIASDSYPLPDGYEQLCRLAGCKNKFGLDASRDIGKSKSRPKIAPKPRF
ncbi:MAG: excisionase family DNA-binding protein [Planctomycetota bacterium]